MQALHGVVAGWADSDPVAAIQWAKNLEAQDQWVLSSVITVWGRKDPSAASRWVMQAPEGPERIEWLQNLGQAWGGKGRTEAAKWGESLKNPEEKAAFFGGIAFSYAMSEPEAGIRWAEALTDPKSRKAGIIQAIRAWSFKDRPAAEKWVTGLAEGDLKKDAQEGLKNRMARRRILTGSAAAAKNPRLSFETPAELTKIASTPLNQARQDAYLAYILPWFEKDREKAAQWVAAKMKGYVLTKTAGAVAREWSKKDPAAAAEWVQQIPPFWRDFVISLGSEWAAESPQEIAPLVMKWPDNQRRQAILRGVCESWAQKDPAAALAWIDALPPGASRTEARKGLVVGWSIKDEAGCRAWVEKLANEEEKQQGKHYILHGMARSKPQAALKNLISRTGEPDPNEFYCFAKEWALTEPAPAGEWAKSLPEGDAKEAALQALLRQWIYLDAVKVGDWAAQLPEKASREAALEAVMEKWVEQNPTEAASWTQGMKDSSKKSEALVAMVKAWGQIDPAEAQKWVASLPNGKEKTVLQEEVNPALDEELTAGEEAPDFSVPTLEGKTIKLSDYRGKYVLLDFWATWCGPCRGETPNLKKVFEAYGKRENFVMIGLSLDQDRDKPRSYGKENGCEWIGGFLGDWGKDKVTKKYGVRGIPSIWLIGPDGKVVQSDLRGDGILQAVSAVLDPKK